jgi:hypothetical protein
MAEPISINPNSACIIIASHISNKKRISYLMECLKSLLQQSIPISIYLSISFDSKELQTLFATIYSEQKHLHHDLLYIWVKHEKTPQMRHMEQLLPLIETKHQWIMFCDDDDTYEPDRVYIFLQTIVNCLEQIRHIALPSKQLAGVYESTFGKQHKEQRHEFWCYCVHVSMLQRFMKVLREYPDILDHKCCDVLFGEYLRRLNDDFLFGSITTKYYNYRVDNNSDSITGEIQQKMRQVRFPKYGITDTNRIECAKDLNEYLVKEGQIYFHDTYLRTIIGNKFDDILKNEFKTEYEILDLVDQGYMGELRAYHDRLREVANQIYDIFI